MLTSSLGRNRRRSRYLQEGGKLGWMGAGRIVGIMHHGRRNDVLVGAHMRMCACLPDPVLLVPRPCLPPVSSHPGLVSSGLCGLVHHKAMKLPHRLLHLLHSLILTTLSSFLSLPGVEAAAAGIRGGRGECQLSTAGL